LPFLSYFLYCSGNRGAAGKLGTAGAAGAGPVGAPGAGAAGVAGRAGGAVGTGLVSPSAPRAVKPARGNPPAMVNNVFIVMLCYCVFRYLLLGQIVLGRATSINVC